jgi:hypothetical protein
MLSYDTSEIDWCEDNYKVSHGIAEFLNTMSNIPILILAIHQYISKGVRRKDISEGVRRETYSFRLLLLNLLFISIPVGSIIFHGMLSSFGQVWDELSIMLFLVRLDISKGATAPILHLYGSLYLLINYPYYHRFYISIVGSTIIHRIVNNIYNKFATSDFRILTPAELSNEDCQEVSFLIKSLVCIAIGTIFWGIDMIICKWLIVSTHWLWHLFSGIGLYYSIKMKENA